MISNITRPQFTVSLMCLDLMRPAEQLAILNSRADGYHIDILDGHFAKNLALSPDFAKACRAYTQLPIEAHLMTNHPNDWIHELASAGVNTISVHAETIGHDAFRTCGAIKDAGCKVGVVLSPSTSFEVAKYYLHHADLLTLMTVDAGYAGQPFVPEMVEKVAEAAALREHKGYSYTIQVDGSCNERTFGLLHQAGADSYVLGSTGLFGLAEDVEQAWDLMLASFEKAVGRRHP